ncbi:MAG: putative protein with domain [Edaphobacter sp.]|jgi:EAL domain-containing protein (putative c-di-GMP-specific phosphodiesterase class I)|nr:putative protein with domain [Edaphobacter sp.]
MQSNSGADQKLQRGSGVFPEFHIVLQPIVDLERERIFAYEALSRGSHGENYAVLIEAIDPLSVPLFNKLALAKALQLADELQLEATGTKLSLNVGPITGMDADYILHTARQYGIKASSIVLELTEGVRMNCVDLHRIIACHRAVGVLIAIDDFGAGYAGLNALATCTPDVLKIDRELITNIESNMVKKTIVKAFAGVCRRLKVRIIAEGVETMAECRTLQGFGINLMQGHLFAPPAACTVPALCFPDKLRRRLPRITREDRQWLRNAIRQ